MAELIMRGVPSLYDVLSQEVQAALNTAATPVSYRNRETIHQRGDASPGLSIVKSGIVRLGNYTKDGKFFSVANLYPGHCFGEFTVFAELPRTHHALAIGKTVVDQISAADFENILSDHPQLRDALMVMLVHRLHTALEFIEDMRTLSLSVRIGKVLLGRIVQERLGNQLEIGVSQDELAELLGVTRVSVNHALKELESEQLIVRGYRAIQVPDLAKLREWVVSEAQISSLS